MTLSAIQSCLNTGTKYELAILRIWSDKDTVRTVLNGVPSCTHPLLNGSEGVCTDCGAHVFTLGLEDNPIDYYKHLYSIINQINAKTVIVETDRFYPPDYTPIANTGALKPYYGFFTGVSRISSYLYLGSKLNKPQNTRYYVYFSEDADFLSDWHNAVITLKDSFSLINLFPMHSSILFVNPDSNDIAFGSRDIDYVVTNARISMKCSGDYSNEI